jgi:putative transposase
MSAHIDTHRDQYGVEPICRTLGLAPSTYYATKTRPPSVRAIRDEATKPEITRVYQSNYRVYGRHKIWRQLQREGTPVGRDQVARLMGELGIAGVVRGKVKRTTVSDPRAERAPDLVERRFVAERPNRLWVADFTYAATWPIPSMSLS